MKTPYDKLAKIYAKHFCHMNKMAATPICGKNPLKIFSRTRKPMTVGLVMLHWGCGAYQVCSNDDPRLTLTYSMSRSNFLPNAFKWEFFCKVDFLNTVEAKVIFLTWYVETNETMLMNKFQRPWLTFNLYSANVAHIGVPSTH